MKKKDLNLIFLRSEKGRYPLKKMSGLLQKSSQRLKYSLSVLEREQIITSPYCIFDYSYFGLILFRVYFRGAYTNEKEKRQTMETIANNPYVTSIYELTGEFDVVVEFACPNPSRFNKEMKRLSALTSALSDYKMILNLVTYLCPRHYLVKSEILQSDAVELIIGGDRERETFTTTERQIIRTLLTNPAIRFTSLAKQTQLNIKTVRSIFNSLKKRNILKGFKYELNTSALGISKFRVFLRLHYLNTEKEAQLTSFLVATKEVVQINKTVGDWDMEVDIESIDKNKIKFFITKIREEFKDLIEKFNLIEFHRYEKRAYLPLYIFEHSSSANTSSSAATSAKITAPTEKL